MVFRKISNSWSAFVQLRADACFSEKLLQTLDGFQLMLKMMFKLVHCQNLAARHFLEEYFLRF
jgi:hypothetical protein